MIDIDPRPYVMPGTPKSPGPDTGLMENMRSSYDAMLLGNTELGLGLERIVRYADRRATAQRLTGKSIWRDDAEVNELAAQFPGIIKTNEQIDADISQHLNEIEQRDASVAQRSTFAGGIGRFVGAMGATMSDPLNASLTIGTMGVGGGATALGRVMTQMAVNGGIEAAQQPYIQGARVAYGLDGGFKQGVMNTLYATAAGGLLQGAGEALRVGAPLAARAGTAAGRAMFDAARTAVDKVRAGGQFGRETINTMSEHVNTMTTEEAAAFHAADAEIDIMAQNPIPTGPTPQTGQAAETLHVARLNDAIAAVAREEMPSLADLPQIDTKKVIIAPDDEIMPAHDIEVDAKAFQFKSGGDEFGVTDRLKGVTEWNPDLAGTVFVWERADGKRFVADGHQRIGLAKRIEAQNPEQEIQVRVRVLRESEGWASERARSYAAGNNIAQGTGSVIDAAKVLRNAPQYLPKLPPQSALVRDANGLALLHDNVFMMAVNERIDARFAALLGRLEADQAKQPAIAQLLADIEPSNLVEAESIIRQAQHSGFTEGKQTDIFGSHEIVENLYKERAKIMSRTLNELRRDKSVFQSLVNNEDLIQGIGGNKLDTSTNEGQAQAAARALTAITKLANMKGEISDALTAAARDAKQSGNYAGAGRKFAARVRSAIADGLLGRVSDGAETGAGDVAAQIGERAEQQATVSHADAVDQLFEREAETVDGAFTDIAARVKSSEDALGDMNASDGGKAAPRAVDEGGQGVIPGAERISDKQLAERNMAKPLQSETVQKPADFGLFDLNARNELDMFTLGLQDNGMGEIVPVQRSLKDIVADIEGDDRLVQAMKDCLL